jgi:hypothetical protein
VASPLIRCGLVAIAVVAGAWLVLGYRALELEADADTAIARAQSGDAKRDDVREGRRLLHHARLLSVDSAPLLSEALLLFGYGRRDEGLAIAQDVVANEPENLGGWVALHVMYSTSRDTRRLTEAARRVRALNPLAGDVLER